MRMATLLTAHFWLFQWRVQITRLLPGLIRPFLIRGLKRISRPGRREYVGRDEIPRVRNGLGVAVLTTSKGLLTDRQARVAGVGGEVICHIW